MAVSFIDANGDRQQVELNGMAHYKEAMTKGISFRQLVNQKYPTAAGQPEAFKQFCASAGLRFKKDEETGIPAANLVDILDPTVDAAGGSFVNQPAVPDSRILFPAAILEVIEDKLNYKYEAVTNAFDSLIGYKKTISTNKFEQPVLNYSGSKGPEDAQFQNIAQLSRPAMMLSLTASDVTRKVPTVAIGMEISREALLSNDLDFVAMSMARFVKVASYNEAIAQLGYILSGDPDAAVTSFSAGTSALSSVTAKSYDSTIAAAGTLTQTAWVKYLMNKSLRMTKTHAIMTQTNLLALDGRTNRPTNVQNNSMDRIDVPFKVVYPAFQDSINIIALPDASWSANTIMGLDANAPALGKVTSTFSEYSAIENVIMRRSTELMVSHGWLMWRLWDDAFDVMTLTV